MPQQGNEIHCGASNACHAFSRFMLTRELNMHPIRPVSLRHVLLPLLAGLLMLSGCGRRNYTSGYGNVFVTYTADAGDFSSYVVTLGSISLTRSDNVVVNAMSSSEVVDFARLSDVAELVSNSSVPIGTYKSASVVLNYGSASAYLNVNGVPTATSIVGPDGKALATVTMTVTFDPANPLVIPQSGAQRLNLNFNLAASSHIDLSGSPIKVTAAPFVTLDNDPGTTKPIRIRGPLVSYSSLQGSYTAYVRPFHDPSSSLGSVTLFSTPGSGYVIDNEGFVGGDGINAITSLATGTITSALTTYVPDPSAGRFNITQAYLGTAQENPAKSRLDGTVVGRSGNALKVRGSTLVLPAGTSTYYPADATVNLSANTVVSIDGQPTATGITIADVSVGQHVIVLGTSSISGNVVTLDATAGRLRIVPARAWGTVTAGGVGSASLELASLDGWPATAFNFAGTGTNTAQDANPAAYLVSGGTTDHAALTGQPAAADGIAAPFGAAPPDFLASSVTPGTSLDSSLEVEFVPGGTTQPFSSVSSTTVVPNLDSQTLGAVHVLRQGLYATDLTSLPSGPSIIASSTGRDTFAIGSAAAGVSVFSSFADFIGALDANTAAVARVTARGTYDAATNTLTASAIHVVLK